MALRNPFAPKSLTQGDLYKDVSWMGRLFCTEIPFDRVGALRLIPMMMGLMIFLATLALSSSVVINNWLSVWHRGFHDGFTVELLPADGNDPEGVAIDVQHQKRVLEYLHTVRGVASTEVVAKSPLTSLIDPFIQHDQGGQKSALSTVIDVTVIPGVVMSLKDVERQLKTLAPGVVLKDHQQWRDSLGRIAHVCFIITSIIAAMMGGAAVMTIGFATHSGLVIHERVIHILRLIGASNRYVADQFQTHAFRLAIRGACWGLVLSIVAFLGAYGLLNESSLTFFAQNMPLTELGLIMIFVPFFLIGMIMVSARLTVRFFLSKAS